MESIQASIIILNYNSYDDIAVILDKVKTRKRGATELNFVIVDNASPITDGKEEVLAALQAADYFIQSRENGGYAKGNNMGIRHAHLQGAQYAFILNPDIEITSEQIFFDMIEDAQTLGEDFLMCGPVVKGVPPFTLRPKVADLVFPSVFRQKVVQLYKQLKNQSIIPAYRVYGCFILLDIEAFMKIGLFDEATFLYIEEAIVAEKAIKQNLKIYIFNDYVVKHNACKSVNKAFRIKKYKFLQESTYIYLHKHRDVNWLIATLISYIIYGTTFYRDYVKREWL
ncbi:MAG: glycosyltransferase family 2 protein, partial [Bacteroidota bacterium]